MINSDFISQTHTHSHNLDDSCKCNNMTNIHQQTKHWFFVVVVVVIQCSVNKISLMYCKIMMIYDYFLFAKIVYVLCFACIFNQWSSMNRSIFDWIDQRMNEKKNKNIIFTFSGERNTRYELLRMKWFDFIFFIQKKKKIILPLIIIIIE